MEPTSKKRNITADLLKGIAVILMVQVHLMELFAIQELYDGLLGKYSLFLGGIPAAPLFMVVMGYFVGNSKKSLGPSLWRGMKIILLGFVLNLGLNFHLLIKIMSGSITLDPLPYIFGVDILFLAGLGIIVLSVFKKIFKQNPKAYFTTIIIIFSVQALLDNFDSPGMRNYFTAYFYGEGLWWSYFPFIPWIAYPLIGILYFSLEKPISAMVQKWRWYILILSGVVSVLFFGFGSSVSSNLEVYYNHGYLFFLYAVCLLVFWTLSIKTIADTWANLFISYLSWIGKNVTAAYVIQWLIIGNIATAIYKTQNIIQLIMWFLVIIMLTSIGIWLWEKYQNRRINRILEL